MSALRKLAAMAVVLASVQSAEAMDFAVDPAYPDFLVIYATGTIERGDANRFRLFLEALPPDLKRLEDHGSAGVYFDSPGGLVMDAMVFAVLIESHKFITGVANHGQCSSACVLLWAAGTTKFAQEHTCIGVHNATADGVAKETDNSGMATWLVMHGAPHSVTAKLVATPNNALSCLTAADLAAWNVTVVP
jgi:ATP-dependent protease ClpP protease subunit